jgi:hypothetical protein
MAQEIVLIVCEGGKTEPEYFKMLCDQLHLTAREIHKVTIVGIGGAPLTVVNEAIKRRDMRLEQSRKKLALKYDHVWAVFDRNGHANVKEARNKAKDNHIGVAFSIPCFEFWFILHHVRTSRQFTNCDDAIRFLEGYLGVSYRKGIVPSDIDDEKKQALAISSAAWLRDQGIEDPYTDVDKLIELLIGIAKSSG